MAAVVGTLCRRRARPELAGTTATHHSSWRDWANLTAGPAGLIAERVLADDVAGYLRFRAVCVSWRRSTLSPQAHDILDRRFHPRRWIMLPEVFAAQLNRRDFLNVATGERIRVDLPQLRHQFVFGHTFDGLILLCQLEGTGTGNGTSSVSVGLLNPLTRQLTTLPNATSLLTKSQSYRLRELMKSHKFSAGLADSSTLALKFDIHELAVAKPKAERWSTWTHFGDHIYSTLSFENRFYCFTTKGLMVMVVDQLTGAGQLVPAVKVDEKFFQASQHCSLVDNGGELILVRRNYVPSNPNKYEVYSVDLDAGKMVPILGLRGRALFVCHNGGRGRALLVQAGLSSSITADKVYECHEGVLGAHSRPRIHAYDLLRGDWITLFDLYDHQGSILDYLSRYACCWEDAVVAPAPL